MTPPRPSPADVRRARAYAKDFAERICAVPAFPPLRRAFLLAIWPPLLPSTVAFPPGLALGWAWALAAGAADLETPTALMFSDGEHVTSVAPARADLPLVRDLAAAIGPLLRQAGYPRATMRLRLWCAIALVWPAETVADLIPALLITPDATIRTADGELRASLDPERRPSEHAFFTAWQAWVMRDAPAPPGPNWTPGGRPRGPARLNGVPPGLYRRLYAKLAGLWRKEEIRVPSEPDFCDYLAAHLTRKRGRTVEVSKWTSKRFREAHSIPWPPDATE